MHSLIDVFKYVEMDDVTTPRTIQEISKLQFLVNNSKKEFGAKSKLEEKVIELFDKTRQV